MSRFPKMVEAVLQDYLALCNKYLPRTIEGLYLHGSIVLDAYVNNSSDIDFISVTRRRMTEKDSDILTLIHKELALKYPKPEMDGVYIIQEDICNIDEKQDYAYYNNGVLNFGEYFNFNPITWYLFKHKGISVIGPDTTSFKVDISSQQIYSYVLTNMNTYWAERVHVMENSIKELKRFRSDMIDDEIEWSVLGLLRQYYTLSEYDIISKQNAGEYGLQHLPEEWHSIIKEAMNIRSGLKVSLFNTEHERIHKTIKFLKYLISHCNEMKNSQSVKNV
ncbi:aminoglycoside adenylyltransferase domain-containing protein [Rossellomorea sp. y25]|uniref:aminoglycoside adenylyltransferase domain-containing protein n=1 Tax=Rossellomorea sp. y25 TaxID=3118174 RepID=UPI00261A52C4|nr:aminoglycoside adenylyltransferase domain-containing protein [uncultured Rossellomorea sp.]